MMTENFVWDDQLLLQKFIEQYLLFFFSFFHKGIEWWSGGRGRLYLSGRFDTNKNGFDGTKNRRLCKSSKNGGFFVVLQEGNAMRIIGPRIHRKRRTKRR